MASTSAEIIQLPTNSVPTLRRSRSTTSEITAEIDLELGSSSISCRICMEDDSTEDNELIAPCLCRGTQEFVHRVCLDRWRSEKEGYFFTHCTTCKAPYQLQMKEDKCDMVTRIKHKLFFAGDVLGVFCILKMIILLLGGFLLYVDYKRAMQNVVRNYSTLLSSQSSIYLYCIIGVLGLIFVLGSFCMVTRAAYFVNADKRIAAALNIFLLMLMYQLLPLKALVIIAIAMVFICGIGYAFYLACTGIRRSWRRHYRILYKRNLTQIFVVVDQRGRYTPPTPDPILEQQLRYHNLL